LQEKITELENCIEKLKSELKKLKSREASSVAELDELQDELGWPQRPISSV